MEPSTSRGNAGPPPAEAFCKTAPMTTPENTKESGGFAETLIGGFVGATVGVLIGLPIANATSVGGMEAIATALLILFLALCTGAALGVGIALRLRGRTRSLVTALATLPAMFIGAYSAVFLATRLSDTDLLLLPLLIVASVLALLGARAVAIPGHGTDDPIRED